MYNFHQIVTHSKNNIKCAFTDYCTLSEWFILPRFQPKYDNRLSGVLQEFEPRIFNKSWALIKVRKFQKQFFCSHLNQKLKEIIFCFLPQGSKMGQIKKLMPLLHCIKYPLIDIIKCLHFFWLILEARAEF